MGSSLAAGGVQVLPDTVQFIKLIHRDDRSDCAAVALDDDVLAAFSVLDQACDAAARGCGDGKSPLRVHVSEDGHASNCTENYTDRK